MVTNNKNKTQWRSRVAKFELGRKGGDLWRNGFRMTQSATIYKRTCLRWTNGVKKVKWAKNSMKHLKRPTSVISHQFPVELVQNVPKLWKQIIVICTALAFALSSLLSFPFFLIQDATNCWEHPWPDLLNQPSETYHSWNVSHNNKILSAGIGGLEMLRLQCTKADLVKENTTIFTNLTTTNITTIINTIS